MGLIKISGLIADCGQTGFSSFIAKQLQKGVELDDTAKFFGAHANLFCKYPFHMPLGITAIVYKLFNSHQTFVLSNML